MMVERLGFGHLRRSHLASHSEFSAETTGKTLRVG